MRCSHVHLPLLGAALLLLSGCKHEFKPFEIPQTRATVLLPNPVTPRQQEVLENGAIMVYAHEDQNDCSYVVSAYPVPKRVGDGERTDKERLLEVSKAVKKHFQVPDDRWLPKDLSDRYHGMEVTFETPDHSQQVRTHLYLVDGVLYTLTSIGTSKWVEAPESGASSTPSC